MRVAEVARALGISPDWLRRLERQGRIPAPARDVHGHRRYTAADVAAIRRAILRSPEIDEWARRHGLVDPPGEGS